MSNNFKKITSGKVLAKNSILNLLGLALPMIVALFTIPMLISGMGTDRFGLLTIIWIGIGYFSLFDLGLGKAATKMISERVGGDVTQTRQIPSIIWTAIYLLLVLGCVGGGLIYLFSEYIVQSMLNIPVILHDEATLSIKILAAGIPIVVVTSALIGVLQSYQRFGAITIIRVPLGVLTFLGPLVSLTYSNSLVLATEVLLFGRIIAFFLYLFVAVLSKEELRAGRFEKKSMVALFKFGSWITISNIIGPFMTYLDRFFVGSILGMTAVTFYVAPYEVISRSKILSKSITSVIFPAFTTTLKNNIVSFVYLYKQSSNVLFFTMIPVMSFLFLLAPELLNLWLGSDFVLNSLYVAQWLSAGWMINALAQPVAILLQSSGRPDLLAKTHMVELFPYLALLWMLTGEFGITGTAAAWFIRATLDAIILNEIAGRVVVEIKNEVSLVRIRILGVILSSIIFVNIENLTIRLILLFLISLWSLFKLWTFINKLIK
jgi:O-antigen/teichoic acid export membrane protein